MSDRDLIDYSGGDVEIYDPHADAVYDDWGHGDLRDNAVPQVVTYNNVEALIQDLPDRVIQEWRTDPAGVLFRARTVQNSLQALHELPGNQGKAIVNHFDYALSDGVRAAIISEVAMGKPAYWPRWDDVDIQANLNTPLGRALVQRWGYGKAARKMQIADFRVERIAAKLSPAGVQELEEFMRAISNYSTAAYLGCIDLLSR